MSGSAVRVILGSHGIDCEIVLAPPAIAAAPAAPTAARTTASATTLSKRLEMSDIVALSPFNFGGNPAHIARHGQPK
jgi:hypothetical protein